VTSREDIGGGLPSDADSEEQRSSTDVTPAEEADEGSAPEVSDPAVVEGSEAEVLRAAFVAARYSGPLPPPDMMRAYGEIVDGGAERILDQWEGETKHRHAIEDRVTDAYIAGRPGRNGLRSSS
jgi:hypothetical protein